MYAIRSYYEVDLTLADPSKFSSIEDAAKAWQTVFDAYKKERSLYPAVVGIESQDLQYGLGTNYDEACRAEGVSAIPTLPPSTNRGDVVRDKITLVTGGAQGFGEGIVRSLVEQGAFVFIADMNGDGAKALADKLNYEACITVAKSISVNVTDEASYNFV